MDEATWSDCQDCEEMLEYLHGKASDRKFRLFACACCRLVWRLLIDDQSRQAVETSERYAEGLATLDDLLTSSWNPPRRRRGSSWNKVRLSPSDQASRSAFASAREGAWEAAWETTRESKALIPYLQCDLIREVFGDPFRFQSIDPSCRWSHDDIVVKFSRMIHEEQCFDNMPILGDALEEAGCEDEDLLEHCRSDVGHVRGCWAIDALLGKR